MRTPGGSPPLWGCPSWKQVDYSLRPCPFRQETGILLCSDGISGVLSPPELMEAMALEPDRGAACWNPWCWKRTCRSRTITQELSFPAADKKGETHMKPLRKLAHLILALMLAAGTALPAQAAFSRAC